MTDDSLPPRDVDDIREYHCSCCGEKGHSKRTCGQTAEERKARRDGRTNERKRR